MGRLVERQQPSHLRVQALIGKRIGRQLVSKKAADNFLGEDDRVQGQEFDYAAATTTDIAPCFLRVGVILTSTL